MNFKKLAVVFGSILLLAMAGRMFPKARTDLDTLTVTGGSATYLTGPTVVGNNINYVHTLPCSPSTFSDHIPVQLSVENGNFSLNTYNIGTGRNDISVSFSGDTTDLNPTLDSSSATSVSDNGDYVTIYIDINATSLSAQTYELNAKISVGHSATGTLQLSGPYKIHVQLTVEPGSCAPNPNCFLTDSEFDLLKDCSGASVPGSSGGTFAIIANHHHVIVATNPGEFYYNMLWKNTGSIAETVVFTLGDINNAVPVGANAVHALTFDSTRFTQNLSSFQMVNQDGTPCGPDGPCTITVPAGNILWVTWHFEYGGIGQSSAGLPTACSGTCSGAASVSVTGYLTSTEPKSEPFTSCGTSACGYLKH